MPQRIVFRSDAGIGVISPANCGIPLHQIALKDVPFGAPFQFVAAESVPPDPAAWTAWAETLTFSDGVGADYGADSANVVTGWTDDGLPIVDPGLA